MMLIVSIALSEPAFEGAVGPSEAARRLRQLANEIESNVVDFSLCPEGQQIAGSREDCSSVAYVTDL
ncbi:cell division protein ZapA [Cupriavidus necator]|uniref:cell division protein ZapA n=1 Tax=Cupriavidus necator TaxID=106590 RepID=UPI0039C2FC4C